MSGFPAFEKAAEAAVTWLGPGPVRILADRIEAGWPDHAALQAVAVPGFSEHAMTVLSGQRTDGVPAAVVAAYLRGLAAGHAQQSAAVRVESVWSGPSTHHVPVRATAQVLVDLVGEADQELLLMTYSAKPHQPLLQALTTALARGVAVTIVVETLGGAGGALGGAEPAAAFISVPGVDLWHWPTGRRDEDAAKMHAKVVVADRRE